MKKFMITLLWVLSFSGAYFWGHSDGWKQGEAVGRFRQLCWSSAGLIATAEDVRFGKKPPLKVIEYAIENSFVSLIDMPVLDPSLCARVLNSLYQYQKKHPDVSFTKTLERKLSTWYYNQSDAGKRNPVVDKN